MLTAIRSRRVYFGWIVVATASLVTFVQVTLFNPVLGVFIPEFEREFGWSRTDISLGVAFGSLFGAFTAPVIGPMIDRYGGRMVVAISAAVMTAVLVLLGLMQSLWQFFLLYAVGRGTAQGVTNLAVSVTVSKWFVRRRGFAVGLATLGNRIGFATLPIGVQLVIDASGWREAVFAMAAMVALLGILPVLSFLQSTPESMGLLPDGDEATPDGRPASPAYVNEQNWARSDAVKTAAFWLVTFALSMQFFAGGAVNLHMIPHLTDRGLSAQTAALVISVSAVFSALGTVLEGVFDERMGTRKTLIVGFLGCALGLVVLMNADSLALGLLFALIYGSGFGVMVTAGQVVFAYYFGRRELGAIRGRAQPFQLVLNAVGPIMGGVAYDQTGSYLAAFIPFAVGYVLAAGALVLARRPELPLRQDGRPRDVAA